MTKAHFNCKLFQNIVLELRVIPFLVIGLSCESQVDNTLKAKPENEGGSADLGPLIMRCSSRGWIAEKLSFPLVGGLDWSGGQELVSHFP